MYNYTNIITYTNTDTNNTNNTIHIIYKINIELCII